MRNYSELIDYLAVQGLIELMDTVPGDPRAFRPTTEGVQVGFLMYSLVGALEEKRAEKVAEEMRKLVPEGMELDVESDVCSLLHTMCELMQLHPEFGEACRHIVETSRDN